jgi:hypothetical protein
MTEKEWLRVTRLTPAPDLSEGKLKYRTPKLEAIKSRASARKLRLFAVACCRPLLHLMTDQLTQRAVEVAEQDADQLATKKEVDFARRQLKAEIRHNKRSMIAANGSEHRAIGWAIGWDQSKYALLADPYEAANNTIMSFEVGFRHEFVASCYTNWPFDVLMEIFGNPFSPAIIQVPWLSSTVLTLAHGIYNEKAFDRMPILADALQETGCDNEDILDHCRQSREHVRGCWVLDLLTGRT